MLFERGRFLVPALSPDYRNQVVEQPHHELRVGPGRLLGDGETTFQLGLGFRMAALEKDGLSKPIQTDGDAVVLRPEQLLAGREAAPVKLLRGIELALGKIRGCRRLTLPTPAAKYCRCVNIRL